MKMINEPIFGIGISLLGYYIGVKIQKRLESSLANPMLIAIIFCILIIRLTGASYDQYMVGGSYLSFLISLSTVALALPFYNNREVFWKYKKAIVLGSCAGALTSILSVLAIGKVAGLDDSLIISLMPKSVTTAIGAPVAEIYGGNYSITAVSIALTGIVGTIIFDKAFKVLGIESHVAKGASLGTASHAMGTSQALMISEKAGAIAGICIVIAGIFTVIAMPILVRVV